MSLADVTEKGLDQLEAEAMCLNSCDVADCDRGTPLEHLTHVRRTNKKRTSAKKSKRAAAAKLDGLR